jgi:prevent-host-death family protein
MATVIGAPEARERFNEIIERVHDSGEEVIVERSGEPLAALVPVDVYERFMAERDARFAALDSFRDSLPEYDEAQVMADVQEAVRAVRRQRADGHS